MEEISQELLRVVDNLAPTRFSQLADELLEEHEKWKQAVRGYALWEVPREGMASDRLAAGLKVVSDIQNTLAKFKVDGRQRNELQRKMHEKMLAAILPHIFGEEWKFSADEILKRTNLQHTKRYMLFGCPRRNGKTLAIAMFNAAVLRCLPFRTRIAVFGRDATASALLFKETIRFAYQTEGGETGWHLGTTNTHPTMRFSRKGRGDPEANELIAMPGTSGRGIGGHIIVLEEAGFMDIDLLLDTVAPLLQVQNTILIAISSNDADETNHFNQWMIARHPKTNELLFDVTHVQRMCPACKMEEKTSCPHVEAPTVDHLDPDATEVIAALMKTSPMRFRAELYGNMESTHMRVLNHKALEALKFVPGVETNGFPFFFVIVDPSGSGSMSKSRSAVSVLGIEPTGNLLVRDLVSFGLGSVWGQACRVDDEQIRGGLVACR